MSQILDANTTQPYKEIPISVPAYGNVAIDEVFRYFRAITLSATGLKVRWGENGDETDLPAVGIGVGLPAYARRINLRNTTASAITATLAFGSQQIDDTRFTTSGTVSVTPVMAAAVVTYADVSVGATSTVQVLAANSSRKSAAVSNFLNNAVSLRIGDSNTGAGRGLQLNAGATMVFNVTGAIYVYNGTSGAVSVGVAEEV